MTVLPIDSKVATDIANRIRKETTLRKMIAVLKKDLPQEEKTRLLTRIATDETEYPLRLIAGLDPQKALERFEQIHQAELQQIRKTMPNYEKLSSQDKDALWFNMAVFMRSKHQAKRIVKNKPDIIVVGAAHSEDFKHKVKPRKYIKVI